MCNIYFGAEINQMKNYITHNDNSNFLVWKYALETCQTNISVIYYQSVPAFDHM